MTVFAQLPEGIRQLVKENRQDNPAFSDLVRGGGYVPPDNEMLIDAITALSMGKKCSFERADRFRENAVC